MNNSDKFINQLIKVINLFPDSLSKISDAFSVGQLESKRWLVSELEKLDIDLGIVFLSAGWYATLAAMMFNSKCKIEKIRSFDIDSSCASIADTINRCHVLDNWKFKASTLDIHAITYPLNYTTLRANKSQVELVEMPTTIVNTSCEHIENFKSWYDKIPLGKLVVLQTNNYFEIQDHINCSSSLEQFAMHTPMTLVHYQGELQLPKYTRYMRIGIK